MAPDPLLPRPGDPAVTLELTAPYVARLEQVMVAGAVRVPRGDASHECDPDLRRAGLLELVRTHGPHGYDLLTLTDAGVEALRQARLLAQNPPS